MSTRGGHRAYGICVGLLLGSCAGQVGETIRGGKENSYFFKEVKESTGAADEQGKERLKKTHYILPLLSPPLCQSV